MEIFSSLAEIILMHIWKTYGKNVNVLSREFPHRLSSMKYVISRETADMFYFFSTSDDVLSEYLNHESGDF